MDYIPTPDTLAYLNGWLAKSERYQVAVKHRRFELTLDEFLTLWGADRLRKLDAWITTGMHGNRMHRKNPYGMVLTWRDSAARKSGVMNMQTARVTARVISQRECGITKGETHSPEACARISKSLTGKTKSEQHKRNISIAMQGRKRGPMSEEQKRAISEGRKRSKGSN